MNEHREDDTDRGKPKCSEKTRSPCHPAHHESQVDWPEIENKLRAKRPWHHQRGITHGKSSEKTQVDTVQSAVICLEPLPTAVNFLGARGYVPLQIDSHLELIRGTKFPKSQSLHIHELAHEQHLLYSHSVSYMLAFTEKQNSGLKKVLGYGACSEHSSHHTCCNMKNILHFAT
jgi:hypothetical protein